jgi:trimeric autotransporter adhesin
MSSTLTRGCRPQLGLRAGWVLCALLAFSGSALFAQTPAGTRIVSRTTGSYEAETGATFTFADSISVVVGQVSGAGITPPRVALGDAGVTSVIGHTLSNMGNGDDSLAVTASSRHGWATRIYRDANGNGALDPGDALLTTAVFLAMRANAEILVSVDVPATAAVRGLIDTVDVRTVSRYDPSVSASLYDVLTIRDAGITIVLSKSANRPSAAVGDVVTYSITYTSSGSGSATELEIIDLIPAGASYVPSTMRLNGVSLTDPDGDDTGFFDVPGNRVIFRIGSVAAGQSGTVTFQVRVDR